MNLGKVGVVFNGGGFTGAFSVGFAKAIWKNGIKPEIIQGVSVGAISAAKILEKGIDELEKTWLEIEKSGASAIFNWWDVAPNIIKRNSGLFNNSGLMKIIEAIDIRKVVYSPTEFQVTTRNESKGWDLSIFRNHDFKNNPESFREILRAATAIQGGLMPIKIGNERHSDGIQYTLEPMVEAGCDTIFLLLNDQANENQMRWDQRLSITRNILHDEYTELYLEKFLREHNDFSVIFEEEENEAMLPIIIQKMKRAVRSVRSVMSSAAQGDDINFVPHRIFVLHTRTPISTLYTFGFAKGDIKAAEEQGYDQASTLIKKILG